jgi:hypothetical protein
MHGSAMVLWAAATVLASEACVDAAPRGPGPEEVVDAIHAAWLAGDREGMHVHVDYRARLADQLGEVWAAAPRVDRERAVAMMQGMFVQTLARYWDEQVAGRTLLTRTRYDGPGAAWVEVATAPEPAAAAPEPAARERGGTPARQEFAWRYRLQRADGVWKVIQREFQLGFARSDTSRFYPMALRRIGADYGRTPTLAELNANLPSLMGRMRQRAFKLDATPRD